MVEKVEIVEVGQNPSKKSKILKHSDLDPNKLLLINFGSLCGMGIGLLGSLWFTNPTVRLWLGVILLVYGAYSIIKNIKSLI